MIQIDNIKNELFRDYCLGIICNHVGLEPEDVLFLEGKKREFLEPKQVLQYALKNNTELGWQQIADLTGKKSHATIMSNCKVVSNLLETSRVFRDKYKPALEMIRVRAVKRCLIVCKDDTPEGKVKEVNNILIKIGKYPVLPSMAKEDSIIDKARKRYTELLQCGSICLIDGYEDSADAVLEHKVAERLGLEILHSENINRTPIMRLNLK